MASHSTMATTMDNLDSICVALFQSLPRDASVSVADARTQNEVLKKVSVLKNWVSTRFGAEPADSVGPGHSEAQKAFLATMAALNCKNLYSSTVAQCFELIAVLLDQFWCNPECPLDNRVQNVFPILVFVVTGDSGHELTSELQKSAFNCAGALFKTVNLHATAAAFFQQFQAVVAPFIMASISAVQRNNDNDVSVAALRALHGVLFDVIAERQLLKVIFPGVFSKLMKFLVESSSVARVQKGTLQVLGPFVARMFSNDAFSVATKRPTDASDASVLNQYCDFCFVVTSDTEWLTKVVPNVETFLLRLVEKHGAAQQPHDPYSAFYRQILASCYKILPPKLVRQLVTKSGFVPDKRLAFEALEAAAKTSLLYKENAAELDALTSIAGSLFDAPGSAQLVLTVVEKAVEELVLLSNERRFAKQKSTRVVNLESVLDTESTQFPSFGAKLAQKSSNYDSSLTVMARSSASFETHAPGHLKTWTGVLDKEMETALGQFLCKLGTAPEIAKEVLGTLVSNMGNSTLKKSITLWMCNQIILGNCEKNGAKDVADEFLVDFEDEPPHSAHLELAEHVYAVYETGTEIIRRFELENEDSNAKMQNFAVAVALDTLSCNVRFFGAEISDTLGDFLPLVVAQLGSRDAMVLEHAQQAMSVFSQTMGLPVRDLIVQNSDYILDSLNLQLVNHNFTPESLKVLLVVINLSGLEILPQMGEIINNCFVLLDNFSHYSALTRAMFGIFMEIAKVVREKYMRGYVFAVEQNEERKPFGMRSLDDVFAYLDAKKQRLHEQIRELEENEAESETEPDSDDELEGSTQYGTETAETEPQDVVFKHTSPVPRNTYLLVQQMCSYCLRFVAYPGLAIRLQVYALLREIIPILATNVQELYPVVYQLWDIVVIDSINEPDIRVNICSLAILQMLVRFGGSFTNTNFQDWYQKMKHGSNKNFKDYAARMHKAQAVGSEELVKSVFQKAQLLAEYFDAINGLLVAGMQNCGGALPLETAVEMLGLVHTGTGTGTNSKLNNIGYYELNNIGYYDYLSRRQ